MHSTETWAKSLGLSVEPTPPTVEDYSKRCPRSSRQVAVRALILQGIVAVASGVNRKPILEWFREQRLWRSVTPEEKAFLNNPLPAKEQRNKFGWHQEAEWTLLWVIGKVESLGLPTRECDTQRLVDEIIPPLGSEIADFLATAKVREPWRVTGSGCAPVGRGPTESTGRSAGPATVPGIRWTAPPVP